MTDVEAHGEKLRDKISTSALKRNQISSTVKQELEGTMIAKLSHVMGSTELIDPVYITAGDVRPFPIRHHREKQEPVLTESMHLPLSDTERPPDSFSEILPYRSPSSSTSMESDATCSLPTSALTSPAHFPQPQPVKDGAANTTFHNESGPLSSFDSNPAAFVGMMEMVGLNAYDVLSAFA